MTFRRRLTLFFLTIVGLPMIAIGVLVVQVSEDSRDGKTDARLSAGLTTARSVYEEALQRAPGEASRIASEAGGPLQRVDMDALARIARREAASEPIASVTIEAPDGEVLASAGPASSVAVGTSDVRVRGGHSIGTVAVATLTADAYLAEVHRLTGREAAVETDSAVLSATTDLGGAELPDSGADGGTDVDVPGPAMRAAALRLIGTPDRARVVLLAPREAGFVASEPLVAVILLLFFTVAFVLIALLLRNLQRRVATMLEAARRIGDGDFTGKVPVEGFDEMSGLAQEFNKMSDRLSSQMGELRRQREELDESVQRIGEAFASGLDRRALLATVIETAATSCNAEGGRMVLTDRPDNAETLATEGLPNELVPVLEVAGAAAAVNRGVGTAAEDGRHAIATAIMDRSERDQVLCTMAVAREGEPFDARELEVLRYLLRQAVISIENIGLHERVAEQAVTDDLTGIPNHRHFSEWIEREVARVDRFGGELSLILIDIDNFKAVNDNYGHLQGDRVLEEIGRIMRIESRGVDESARYGGEEFVLALPETSAEGAAEVAERLRRRIERTRVASTSGGAPIEVTASLGVATMPNDGTDARALIAAADEALYGAKGSGKNRISLARGVAGPASEGNGSSRRS